VEGNAGPGGGLTRHPISQVPLQASSLLNDPLRSPRLKSEGGPIVYPFTSGEASRAGGEKIFPEQYEAKKHPERRRQE
jgi:hypothetical protein